MGGSDTRATFQAGDHLRVRRDWGYFHHGIYTDVGTVVQFGGRIIDKGYARIEEVAFADFEQNGKVEKVDQARLKWPSANWELPDAFPPDTVVARARCLTRLNLTGIYNLFGSNCETVALWCTCGFAESLQRQVLNQWKTRLSLILLLWTSYNARQEAPKNYFKFAIWAFVVFGLAEHAMYLVNNRRFYLSVKACDNHRTHESTHTRPRETSITHAESSDLIVETRKDQKPPRILMVNFL